MAETEAMLGYGSHFQVETNPGDSPNVFLDLGEVTNITPPSFQVDQVDTTHMQSPGRIREFIDGLIDPGECSFEMNYIPGSASDQALLDILNIPVGELRRRRCRIIYPNNVQDTFSANLQNYQPTVPTDDKMTAEVSWRVTGVLTRAAAAAPVNIVLPAISGVLEESETLTAFEGNWSGAPSFEYQWFTVSDSPPTPISGATGKTYTLESGDAGTTIAVTVTATNSEGSTSATSAPVVIAA